MRLQLRSRFLTTNYKIGKFLLKKDEFENCKQKVIFLVLTKTGTQLEPPGTIRNQLEPAENHLEPAGTGSE